MNGLTVGGLFDGVGLLAYGLHRAGLEHAWLCEVDEWRRGILAQRFPGIPVIDDVRAVGADSVRRVDVIAGGFPCKGASSAGKRNGFDHPETVLWREMARAVRELRPRYVLVENVADILSLHDGAVWGEVVGDLASLGFDIEWDCIPAAAVGAPHRRDRVFAVASHPDRAGRLPQLDGDAVPSRAQLARLGGDDGAAADPELGRSSAELAGDQAGPGAAAVDWREYEPAVRRWERVHGPAPEPLLRGVDARPAARVVRSRLSALGDGVQVQVAELVGRYIVEREADRMKAEAA